MVPDPELRCTNCGAPLGPDDEFCGECGSPGPRTAAAGPAGPAPATQPPPTPEIEPPVPIFRPENPPPPAGPVLSPGRRTAASIVAVVCVLAAVVLCSFGLVLGFFAPDPELGQAGTEDMLLGALRLCFCPGGVALTIATVLWTRVLRRR